MENLGLFVLVGVGAYYLLTRNAGPIYRDINGRIITDIVCGNSITFDVLGYNRVWLSQLKNGQLIFDAPFDVPMPPYILNCQNETGQYEIAVYKLVSPGDTKGELIGQTTFTVLPGVIA